ncbi:MAG: hypothetical protein RLZZ244_853 [Verrucomicrobiota bacterium]
MPADPQEGKRFFINTGAGARFSAPPPEPSGIPPVQIRAPDGFPWYTEYAMASRPSTSPFPCPPILRISVSDQVLAALRSQIALGQIPPLSPVPECQLAQELGVSRVPVREALFQMERDGLLVRSPQGKWMVRSFSAEDARHLASLRIPLEGFAARLASTSALASDLEALRENIAAFDAAHSPEALAQRDVQFHERLCLSAHHPWLLAAWQTLRWPLETLLVRSFRAYCTATSLAESKSSTADHSRIVEAIAQKKPDEAERLLRQHISRWEEWTSPA